MDVERERGVQASRGFLKREMAEGERRVTGGRGALMAGVEHTSYVSSLRNPWAPRKQWLGLLPESAATSCFVRLSAGNPVIFR